MDRLAVKDPALAQAVLLSKLLGALLAERASRTVAAFPRDWFATLQRPVSLWRWLTFWTDAVWMAVHGPLSLHARGAALPRLQRHLCDPPRKRVQQAASARALLRARDHPDLGPPMPGVLNTHLPELAYAQVNAYGPWGEGPLAGLTHHSYRRSSAVSRRPYLTIVPSTQV